MVIGINKKDLELARFMRIMQEQSDLDRQIRAAMALTDEALEKGDEKKAERYAQKSIELVTKHLELTDELINITFK